MKTTSEYKMVHEIIPTEEELAVLEHADAILGEIVHTFSYGKDYRLISPSTGEVIDISDIKRARGILNGIYANRTWFGIE